MSKMTKGAIYVIAVEVEDPEEANDDTREGILKSLIGAVRRCSGSGATHGKEIKVMNPGCRIMRYSITAEDKTEKEN
jgi:hypothetical protein